MTSFSVIRLGLALGSTRRRFHKAKRLKEPLGESIKRDKTKKRDCSVSLFCDPLGARTQDPNIKSVVLYQLS